MEKFVLVVCLTLIGISPVKAQSYEAIPIGRDKFEMSYESLFKNRRGALLAANQFCKVSGFAWMEESSDDGSALRFFCMRPGETINRRPAREVPDPVVVLPLR